MGGAGYSDIDEFKNVYNLPWASDRLILMNAMIAKKINKKATGFSTTDVIDTEAAQYISDFMMMTFVTFLQQSSATNPPEFIHYKLPHFTPDMLEALADMAMESTSRGVVS